MGKSSSKKRLIAITMLIIAILFSIAFIVRLKVPISNAGDNEKIIMQAALDKYVNYNISEQDKGTVVQYSVITGVDYIEYVPIKQSELNIRLGQIDNKYPYEVKVFAKSTEATNGNLSNNTRYEYNMNFGTLKIMTNNQDENGEAIFAGGNNRDIDEYSIICYYDTYTAENVERDLSFEVSANIQLYNEESSIISNTGTFEKKVFENEGNLTSITYKKDEIFNGNIKSNIINKTTNDTEYEETAELIVSKKEMQENIVISENNSLVKITRNQQGVEDFTDIGNNENIVYKSTKLLKQDIENLIGTEGFIEILSMDDEVLYTINKETEFNEDGSIIINFDKQFEAIKINISNIQNEGILRIINTKEIKSKMNITNNIGVKTSYQIVGTAEDLIKYNLENSVLTEIKESTTEVRAELNKVNFTNKQQNEVMFNVYLDSTNSSKNLFKNPNINIVLPDEVEKVILGNSFVVYGNGLEIKETKIEKNRDNRFVIVANLVGAQTQYTNQLGLATNIEIPATIILKKDIENTESNIEINYTNEFSLTGNVEIGNIQKAINIENYKEEEQTTDLSLFESTENFNMMQVNANSIEGLELEVVPVKGDTILQSGDVVYEGEFIKYNIKIANTTEEDMQNVKVVATIPEGVTYGELKETAGANTGNEYLKYHYEMNDSLTEKIINISTLKAQENVTVFYEVKADDVETDKTINTNIKAYVQNAEASNVNIENVIRDGEYQVFVEGYILENGKDISYEVTVVGNQTKNPVLSLQLPEIVNLKYIATKGEVIDASNYQVNNNLVTMEVEAGAGNETDEHPTGRYIFVGKISNAAIRELSESTKELKVVAKASIDGVTYTSNECRKTYKANDLDVTIVSTNESEEVKYGEEINYEITIKNKAKALSINSTKESRPILVNLLDYLPKEVKPIQVVYEDYVAQKQAADDTNHADGKKNGFIITGYNKEEKTQDISGRSTNGNGEQIADVNIYLNVKNGQSVKVLVKAKAGIVYEKTKIENSVSITYEKTGDGNIDENEEKIIETKTSNIISHYILPYNYGLVDEDYSSPITPTNPEDPSNPSNPTEPSNPGNPENPSNPNDPNNPNNPNSPEVQSKYSISGVAWIDENEDGNRQSTEKTLNGISIMLINTATSSVVSRTESSYNGIYSFGNVNSGNYLVLFKYDTSKYRTTKYRQTGVPSSSNSDVTTQEINIDGAKTKAAVTDTINLNSNVSDIDMGLIENKKCDLSIDKYVSKVTVKTHKGTKTYDFNKQKLAKIEIRAKEIEGATVVVEYKLIITNTGEIATTLNKLTDNISDGLKFSSQLNTNWVQNTSGEIINLSNSNTSINPGESIEVKLVATKTMTGDSTGTFTNIAQISETSTIAGTSDMVPENNSSQADIIISISTGTVVYLSLMFAVLILLGVGVILVKRFGTKEVKKGITIGALLIALTAGYTTSSYAEYFYYDWDRNYPWVLGVGGYASSYAYLGYGCGFIGASGGLEARCYMHGVTASHTTSYYYSGTSVWETDSEVWQDSAFTLDKVETEPIAVLEGRNVIVGPFSLECSDNLAHAISVYDNYGNIINVTLCDQNKNEISSLSGTNCTFYVKIPINNLRNGLSVVKACTEKEGRVYKKTIYEGQDQYDPYDGGQGCQEYYTYVPGEEIEIIDTALTRAEIEWSILEIVEIYGQLNIFKYDADNNSVKIPNVEIKLKYRENLSDVAQYVKAVTENNNYQGNVNIISQTTTNEEDATVFKTDENGNLSFNFLKAGSGISRGIYTIAEVNNPNYGYKTIEFQRVFLNLQNIARDLMLPNYKETGILSIKKVDKVTEEPMEGVGFKINNGNGYIKVTTESNNVKGNVRVIDMELTTMENATEFITDSNGEINIYNIKTGTYFIEETSINGENANWYDSDDEDLITYQNNGAITVHRQKSYITQETTNIINDIARTIADGTYEIESHVSEKKDNETYVLDVMDQNVANGTNIQIYKRNNEANQRFYIKYIGNGCYNITNISSSKNVAVSGNGTEPSTLIEIDGIDNSLKSQIWKIVQSTIDGYYWIIPTGNETLAMDVKGGYENATNGTVVQIYTKHQNDTAWAQRWKFNDIGGYKENVKDVIKVQDTRKYIDLSGTVWEDQREGKQSLYNFKYDEKDIKVKGLVVRLKDNNDNVIQTTVTDSDGKYKFQQIEIKKLNNYYVEFEYDGEIYTSGLSYEELGADASSAETSKAQEVAKERTAVDSNYSSIQGTGQRNSSKVTTTKDNTFTVSYENDVLGKLPISTSKNMVYFKRQLNENNKVRDVNSFNGYENYSYNKVTANTGDKESKGGTGYKVLGNQTIENIINNGITEIGNINLCLRQRDRVNLSIMLDVDNIEVQANGYSNKYIYGNRNIESPRNENEVKEFIEESDKWLYERKLYASDIVAHAMNKMDYKVYVTYKMVVNNNSSTLNAKIDEVTSYYDSKYKFLGAGRNTADLANKTTNIDATPNKASEETNKYVGQEINALLGMTLKAGQSSDAIYLKYELSEDNLEKILNGQEKITRNVVEINKYSTYYGERTYYHTGDGTRAGLYASIDANSAPGNMILGDIEHTYEDDTNVSPFVRFIVNTQEERTISGNVFEDATSEELKKNTERLGNGVFNAKEDGTLKNVKVELLSYKASDTEDSEKQIAKLYINSNGNKQEIDAIYTTEANGAYAFTGIIPNEYIIRYTYSDGTVVYKNNKVIKTISTVENYKSTIIKSPVIKDALNNNKIVGNGSTANKTIKHDGKEYDSNKWHIISEGDTRYSDAVDEKSVISNSLISKTIMNENYNSSGVYQGISSKAAYTGAINVQVEFDAKELSGTAKNTSVEITEITKQGNRIIVNANLKHEVSNVDFGIAEKARQSIDLNKEVTNIKIIMSDGKVLIDGDPRETGENALQYVTYPPAERERRSRTVAIQLQDELIHGSTLEIEYTITATNNSEINYLTEDYYKYGTSKDNIETINVSKVIDYLSNDLSYKETVKGNIQVLDNDENGIVKIDGSEIDLKKYLADKFEQEVISDFVNKLLLTSTKKLKPTEIEEWIYVAERVITPSDDPEYDGPTEIIEYTTPDPPIEETPGNYDPTSSSPDEDPNDEPDDYDVIVTITDPYGANRNLTYFVIGAFALIILVTGVVIIRKKVM